ncbi:hypothetical protein [Streptomyces sp. NPDC021622]|uniref:hypothetical protein n=1 Tax=Streptomyces sp. NPDC021622 TaxID=3155013 RepID=UPI0033FB4A84
MPVERGPLPAQASCGPLPLARVMRGRLPRARVMRGPPGSGGVLLLELIVRVRVLMWAAVRARAPTWAAEGVRSYAVRGVRGERGTLPAQASCGLPMPARVMGGLPVLARVMGSPPMLARVMRSPPMLARVMGGLLPPARGSCGRLVVPARVMGDLLLYG